MKNLVNILEEKTQSFKKTYLELTKEWAAKYFDIIIERKDWKDLDWCKHLGLTPGYSRFDREQKNLGFPDGFYNKKEAKTYDRLKTEVYKLSSLGKEAYIAKELVNAERSFQSSLEKLAFRIQKKELNEKNLEVTSLHKNVNLEVTITDGEKTVRAFTIIASGPIQRPHYRYLVK
jgi:hypothetical protein